MMTIPRRPIQTERLVLEPLSVAHAPLLYRAIDASRDHLSRFLAWAHDSTFDTALQFLVGAEPAWEKGSEFHFAICVGGVPSGVISLRRGLDQEAEGNIGYWIAASSSRQGLMTEALAAAVEFGFHTLALHRVELRALVTNRASQRVAEKVGMRREGRARCAILRDGVAEDAYLYGIVHTDPRGEGRSGERPQDVPAITEPDFTHGLVTAVAQDELDGTVLMVAHMDEEAYARTRSTGHAWFWSRSRASLWEKGETSGNFLVVSSVTLDCDGDAVLLRVAPAGPACHTGARTCFHNPV